MRKDRPADRERRALLMARRRLDQEQVAQIGARVRSRRVELGLGQEDLAHLVGVSVPTISRTEAGLGSDRLGDLLPIAAALRVSMGYLLGEASQALADELRQTFGDSDLGALLSNIGYVYAEQSPGNRALLHELLEVLVRWGTSHGVLVSQHPDQLSRDIATPGAIHDRIMLGEHSRCESIAPSTGEADEPKP